MLRSASKTCNSLRSVRSKLSIRQQSGGPGGDGGAGKMIGMAVAAVGAGTAGTIGYAYYDPEFRKKMEDTVPQLKPVLQPILGDPRDTSKPLSSYLPAMPKKKESEKDEIPKKSPPTEKKPEPKAPVQPVAAPQPSSKDKKIDRAEKDAEIDKRLVQREEEVKKINQKLEKSLRSSMHTAEVIVKSAQDAKDATVIAIVNHTKLLKVAVEDPNTSKKDPQWEQVSQAYETVQAALTTDKKRDNEARLELERLRKLINEGRSSKDTSENAIINEANQMLSKLTFNLDEFQAKVNKANTEGKIMTEFKRIIEQGRKQFAEELRSIMPNIEAKLKSGSSQKLSDDELNALIAHAHVRVDQLRQQLADQQLREQQHIEQAMERQKAENSKFADDRVERELEKLRGESDVGSNEKVAQARQEFEDELRKQLRRQAAAHSEHLEDVLRAQKEQLTVQSKREVEEAILKEREVFTRQLASSVARLQAIEVALEGRSDLDNENRRAKELWLACQSLKTAIVKGRSGRDYDSRRKPLANEIMAIKEASGKDTFVGTLVGAVPDSALASGVYSEDDLKERFAKVNKLCRRTARIGEDGGSLFQYGLSYLQSTIIWDASPETTSETEIDTSKIDTFEILNRASYCVEKKDFQTAVKLMMLLKGEPARIASDWVKDTRDHLETRQAAELLMAHAAAQSVRTYY